MRTLVTGVGVAVLTCAALSGCSPPTLDRADLQTDITDRMKTKPQSVTCKGDLKGVVGKTTRCEVVLNETNAFELVATVTGVDGITVSYDVTPALSKEQLEKKVGGVVTQNSGDKVETVDCESGLEGEVDNEAHCKVGTGGATMATTVKVTRVHGLMMDFSVTPD